MRSSDLYQKYTPREHILARPDSYIGSIEIDVDTQWVLNDDKTKMIQKQILVHLKRSRQTLYQPLLR